MKSKIHRVSENNRMGSKYIIEDSIVVNKHFLFSFEFDKIYDAISAREMIETLEFYLDNNTPQLRFKYQKKNHETVIKVLNKLKEWGENELIYVDEAMF